jgi:cytidine deaminase
MNDDLEQQLIEAAARARGHAYAPYSRFTVGSAVRGASGAVYGGANVENASYGLAICAERSAVVSAISAGETRLTAAVVLTSSSPPAGPCGACRQVLAEFGADDLPVVLVNDRGERTATTLGALLPRAFRRQDLP